MLNEITVPGEYMQTFCIIGGGGFIGTNLALHLLDQGHRVRTFGNPGPHTEALAECRQWITHFGDLDQLREAVKGCDGVYHLIGRTVLPDAEKDKAKDIDRILQNTLRLMDLSVSGHFGRLIFISSGGTVYGIPSQIPIKENSSDWPISSYGVSKLTIERYLHVYRHQYGLDYRTARISNPFGAYQLPDKGQGVIARLIDSSLREIDFPLMGDGSVIRDYIYIDDVSDALHRLADYGGEQRIFNIGSGNGHSLMEIIRLVEKTTGREINLKRLPGRPMDVPVNILDIELAKRELHWSPQTPLPLALEHTVRWLAQYIAR